VKHPSPIDLSRALVEGVDVRLRAHLDICDDCNEALATHASIADDVRQLPVVDPDEDRSRLLRASLFAAARTPAPSPRRGFFLGFALAGGLAAAAVTAFLLVRSSEPAHVARGTIQPHDGAEVVHIDKPDEIVRLSSGTVTVKVAQLDTHERFRVVIGDAEIESRGAAFDVRAKRDRLESVRVYDGRVEIRAEGAPPRTLVAGERWEIELAQNTPTEKDPAAVAVANLANADSAAEDLAIADPSTATPSIAAPSVADPSAAGRSVAEPSTAKPSIAATAKPSVSDSSTAKPSAAKPSAAKPSVASPSTAKSATAQPSLEPSSAVSTTTKSTPGKSVPNPAPSKIQATDKPSMPRARAKRPIEVLFDEGFATLTSGDPAMAAQIFERAARSAPSDPLAEDASFWRASSLVRAKSSAAAGALESFLARYKNSPRVGEASAMLGWLVLDRDLDRAEKLFRTAETDKVASVRASATKGLAAVTARRAK
jgi:TolA-binding protein